MSNLEIKQGENKFYIGDDENNALAEITYRFVDNNEINIDHTGVSDELGGQGVGKKLVKAVVEHARENHLKIIGLMFICQTYVRKRRFISRCISWLNKFCDGATVPSLFCSHQYKIAKRLVILHFKLYAINSFSFLVYFLY